MGKTAFCDVRDNPEEVKGIRDCRQRPEFAGGITNVIHYQGKPIKKLRRSWVRVALAAGHAIETGKNKQGYPVCDNPDGPHICRHTCATWLMQSGVDQYEAAGYLGMSPETLWNVYGHHSPLFQDKAATAIGRRKPVT